MDGFLRGCGGLGAILVCQAMLVIVVVVHNIGALDGGGRTFVEAAIPAIATTWDEQAMLDRASPKFKTATTPVQLAALFGKLAPLGTML